MHSGHLILSVSAENQGVDAYCSQVFLLQQSRDAGAGSPPPCGPLSLWRPQRQLLDFCLTTGKIIIRSGCRVLVVDLEAVTKGLVSSPDRGVSPSAYALLVTALFGFLESRRDSSSMKTRAVVTMVFLPGTFIATFFAMPLFDWQASNGQVVDKRIRIFFGHNSFDSFYLCCLVGVVHIED